MCAGPSTGRLPPDVRAVGLVAKPREPSHDRCFRDRHDEARAPVTRVAELRDDLVLEVPRQDEDVVRLYLVDARWMEDWNVGSGQELALLVGVTVYRELDEITSDAAIVQQRVAFARSAIADDALARSLGLDQELEQLALGLPDLLFEPGVRLDSTVARCFLAR